MKSLVALLVLFVTMSTFAQRRSSDYNRLGIFAGYAMMNYFTDDFDMQSKGGIYAGFETRGSFKNNWDMVYGISMWTQNFTAQTVSFGEQEYNQLGGQIKLLASYNFIPERVSTEIGLGVRIQGELKPDKSIFPNGGVALANSAIDASDTIESNLIGVDGIMGITAGLNSFRASISYHYTLTNVFDYKDLNGEKIKANTGMLVIGAVIYL